MSIQFKIFKNERRDFIVKRIGGSYNQHAHLCTYDMAKQLVRMIKARRLPNSKWMRGSCKRLLTQEEYDGLKESKQRYYNHNKKNYHGSYR